jgi:hypothetical protein
MSVKRGKVAYFKRETERQRTARLKKYERIQGLKALLATHEQAAKRNPEYIRDLKTRIRSAECQFDNMRGDLL